MTTRTVALDLGAARCGVAIDDELGLFAHQRPNLEARNQAQLVKALVALAQEEGVGRFVVGLPLDMSGAEGKAAKAARLFAQSLADATRLPVTLWDERWSTKQAARNLRERGLSAKAQKPLIDGASAATLLQAFLDGQKLQAKTRAIAAPAKSVPPARLTQAEPMLEVPGEIGTQTSDKQSEGT